MTEAIVHHALRSDEVADLQDLEASVRRLNDVRVTFETGRVCYVESCHNRDAVCIVTNAGGCPACGGDGIDGDEGCRNCHGSGVAGTSDLQLCRDHAMVLFDGLTEALRG